MSVYKDFYNSFCKLKPNLRASTRQTEVNDLWKSLKEDKVNFSENAIRKINEFKTKAKTSSDNN